MLQEEEEEEGEAIIEQDGSTEDEEEEEVDVVAEVAGGDVPANAGVRGGMHRVHKLECAENACGACGWTNNIMAYRCEEEWSDEHDIEWKEYQHSIRDDGTEGSKELKKMIGSRGEFMW